MKDKYGPRSKMTITSCTFHLFHCLLLWLPAISLPLPHFSSVSFTASACHSLSYFLISNSTFHQLLVSPNSCHVDVDRLETFSSHTLQMWLIKVEGGVRVEKVTGCCIKLLHLPAFPLMSC